MLRDLDGLARIFECYNAGKADVPAALYELLCQFQAARVTVEHTSYGREFIHNMKAVLVRLALMDDDRKRKLLRQRHLHPERLFLHLARNVLVVII